MRQIQLDTRNGVVQPGCQHKIAIPGLSATSGVPETTLSLRSYTRTCRGQSWRHKEGEGRAHLSGNPRHAAQTPLRNTTRATRQEPLMSHQTG